VLCGAGALARVFSGGHVAVGKPHMVKLNPPRSGRGPGNRRRSNLSGSIQKLEHPFTRGHRGLQNVVFFAEILNGPEEALGILDERRKNILRAIPHLTGGVEVLNEARSLIRNARSVAALDHLEEIHSIFDRLGLARHLTIDLGEVRGFDYYTGILFRAYIPQLGFEVASGGRYDSLAATFGEDLTAVGFSFSLDRLEQVATPQLDVPDSQATTVSGDAAGFERALELRKSGKMVKRCL